MIGLIAWTQHLIHFQLKCPCNQDAQQNDPDPYPAKKRDHHLLDARSRPYSRKPAFNKNRLEKVLPENGIEYSWLGDKLG